MSNARSRSESDSPDKSISTSPKETLILGRFFFAQPRNHSFDPALTNNDLYLETKRDLSGAVDTSKYAVRCFSLANPSNTFMIRAVFP